MSTVINIEIVVENHPVEVYADGVLVEKLSREGDSVEVCIYHGHDVRVVELSGESLEDASEEESDD